MKYAIPTPDIKTARAVEAALISLGYRWVSSSDPVTHKWDKLELYNPRTFSVDVDNLIIGSGSSYGTTAVTLDKVIQESLTPLLRVKLNEEYEATVSRDKKSVKVGCQTFTRESVEALWKAFQ